MEEVPDPNQLIHFHLVRIERERSLLVRVWFVANSLALADVRNPEIHQLLETRGYFRGEA